MITLDSRLAVAPHARFRRFDDEGVVVNQSTAEAIVVNEVGARLLQLADGTRTLEECVRTIGTEFDAEAEAIAADILRFANELVDAGVAEAR
jgi:hypothetical protein